LGCYAIGCGGPGAERDEVLAVVLLAEAVLEAVLPVTVRAVHAGVLERVDQRLASWLRALRRRENGRFLRGREGSGGCANAVLPPVLGPFASMGALVGGFGAVVEAEGVVAGVAAEGEEVELVAVGELAVRANGFEVVVVHFCE
jgi:hypothetical protein